MPDRTRSRDHAASCFCLARDRGIAAVREYEMVQSSAHSLVVEDATLVAEVVTEALEPTYQTTHAETCAAALASLRKGGIHAILLDCTLPDGVDPALLAEADAAGVAVVVMSGHPDMAERVAGA